MITFRCRCSHPFSVPDDQAGESIQCPACGLLVDVPTLEQIGDLEDDGTSYVLRDEIAPKSTHFPDAADTPSVLRREGDKDRRLSLSEFLKIGTTEDDLLEIKDEVRPGIPKHPKYDPVTGELIVPLDIVRPKPKQPMMAQPVVLGYETAKRQGGPTIWTPFVLMFELPNVVVTTIITAMFLGTFVGLMVGATIWLLLLLVLPMILMILSHFANVIDETGPTANDELPRPMRSANMYEDMLRPIVQISFAYFLAYLPIILFNLYVKRLGAAENVGLLLLFFVLVPALQLTAITSGAVNNMLPTRALSVISAAGKHYWIAAGMGVVATISFCVAVIFCLEFGDAILRRLFVGPIINMSSLTGLHIYIELLLVPVIVYVCMYLIQVYCWQLGIIYRLHHERFQWVLQKHDKSDRTDTVAQLHQHRQRQLQDRARKAQENLAARQRPPGPNLPQ